jgi:RND superfamily putative drug exporter
VALGTDYNILMISRLREEAVGGRGPREAAALAVRRAGPTIADAGLILAGSFASLILAGGSTLSQMGFAISFGLAASRRCTRSNTSLYRSPGGAGGAHRHAAT